MSLTRRAVAGVLTLTLLGGPPALAAGSAAAEPAAASTAAVAVAELPQRYRADPRAATPAGLTDGYGVAALREPDPEPSDRDPWASVPVLADGSKVTTLDRQVVTVFGDRLVGPAAWETATSVPSRVLPAETWTDTPVPDGWRLLDYTADGLLVLDTAAGSRLAVVPWDDSALRVVAGVPAGVMLSAMRDRRAGPAQHGSVLRIWDSAAGTADWLYVDTAATAAWRLGLTGAGACAPGGGDVPWGLHDQTLAWYAVSTPGTVPGQLCTLDLPAAGDRTVPAPGSRPAPTMPGVTNPFLEVGVLPFGDEVVTWRRPGSGTGSLPASTQLPVTAIAADGTTRVLAGWGHNVRPAGSGRILLVGGADYTDTAIRVLATDGTSEVAAELPRIRALYQAIAVDDNRVVFVDDSAPRQAVVENVLQASGGWRSDGTVVDSGVTAALAARDGSLAWAPAGTDTTVGNAWALRSPDGTIRRGPAPLSGITAKQYTAVSGDWLLRTTFGYYGADYLLDARDGSHTPTRSRSAGADLLGGVLYLPNTSVPGAPDNTVVARDLASDQGTLIPAPGCPRVGSVRAAGTWMLLFCLGGYSVVVDATGATAPRTVPGDAQLGNGFLVRSNTGVLEWADLSAAGDLAWRQVAEMPADTLAGVTSWAVSRGSVPTVVWFSTRTAVMATLPVATGAAPASPADVAAPTVPADVRPDPTDRAVTLRWAPAAARERVLAYEVKVGNKTTTVRPPATSATVSGLTNGTGYTASVTAVNAAGEATSAPVTATPLAAPAPPRNVRVSVDPLTSRTTVTWDWQPASNSEPLTRFEVWSTDPLVATSTEARSASFVVPDAGSGMLRVLAVGPRQTSGTHSELTAWPGVDRVRPTVSARVRGPVVFSARTTVSVAASDDRQLSTVDVRMRTARPGGRLGAWRAPAAWQRRAAGPVTVTRLRRGWTYCFSARARDHADNISAWTRRTCTAVPVDDRASANAGWHNLTGSHWFAGTARRATGGRAELVFPRVDGDAAWLVATTCPRCGKVQVVVNGATHAPVSLRSTRVRHRRLLPVPWSGPLRGRVVLRPVAGTGAVIVDGLAVRAR